LPPAQIKAFTANRGTRAKTDRIDAELIAQFMAFRPGAGRTLPAQKLGLLRALTGKRSQLVETRKPILAQIKARQKQGLGEPFEEIDDALHLLIDAQIAELDSKIKRLTRSDQTLAETAQITLHSRDRTCRQHCAYR
jgi:transposase